MKNLLLLTSLISILLFGKTLLANDLGDELYSRAQVSYKKNDCKRTIKLLTKYLVTEKPDEKKIFSIYSVIGWCTTYLEKGQVYHHVSGWSGPDRSYYEETPLGKTMKENKIKMPGVTKTKQNTESK